VGDGVERQQPVPGAVSGPDRDAGAPVAFVVPRDLINTSAQGWPAFELDDL